MKEQKMKCKEAFDFLKSRHPSSSPNPGFLQQLTQYEGYLFLKT